MSLLKVDKSKLVEPKIKTTPQNVKEPIWRCFVLQ